MLLMHLPTTVLQRNLLCLLFQSLVVRFGRLWYNKIKESLFTGEERMDKIIAACGNDCSACPRYVKHPYEKTEKELLHTAELWMMIGYRDHVVSAGEISCTGCKPENWCRYQIVKCCEERGIASCADCPERPCKKLSECFAVTRSFEPICRKVCTDREYEQLRIAFFEKEKNLGLQ